MEHRLERPARRTGELSDILEAAMNHLEARDYLQHVFLACLYRDGGFADGVFIGGTFLRQCVFPGYRFSEDLDFAVNMETKVAEEIFEAAAEKTEEIVAMDYGGNVSIASTGVEWKKDGKTKAFSLLQLLTFVPLEKIKVQEDWKLLPNEFASVDSPDIVGCELRQVVSWKLAALTKRRKARDIYDLWQLLIQFPSIFFEGCSDYESEWKIFKGDTPNSIIGSLNLDTEEFEEAWQEDKKMGFIPNNADFATALEHLLASLPFNDPFR